MRRFLGQFRAIRGLRDDLQEFRHVHLSGQQRLVAQYLREAKTPALHLGANRSTLPGWFDTDVEPIKGSCTYLDATKPFPFPDGSLQFVYAEHMIEHISREAGSAMLGECRRVLRAGGVLRITTPDLAFILGLYPTPSPVGRCYMDWMSARFMKDPRRNDPVSVINNAFRAWGHQFLYDEPTLRAALSDAGFGTIERVVYGESSHKELRGIEQHGRNVGNEEMARQETMLFEAS